MSYNERRVKVKNYGTLPARSELLVEVPGTRGKPRKLHTLAAAAFVEMGEAIFRDLGIEVLAASAWRRHRWRSRTHYEEKLIAKYGSVRAGRRWLAYNSPHETGLAVDFGVGGLAPSRKTAGAQRKTPLHAWLVEHAHEYGWHPYKVEPWHWEFPLSQSAFKSGIAGDDEAGPASFSSEDGDDEDDGIIEEFDEESAAWFAADGEGDAAGFVDIPEPKGEAQAGAVSARGTRLRSGEFEGEFSGGEGQGPIRWRIRWRLD